MIDYTPRLFMDNRERLQAQNELCSCGAGRQFVTDDPKIFWNHNIDCPAFAYGADGVDFRGYYE